MKDKDLCDIAREIFEENKDFDEAYALAEKHANELREYIYDGNFLNQRRTTPLHIAVQQISDPEQYELVTLFYDKNEPWVLLQLNDEGLSALDILCRNGNEWLIRFLLPDSYNFDIDGIPDEDIESIDDDDITLYDIFNMRFKHYVAQEDEEEKNNELRLLYTLSHEPQSYPLAVCIRANNLNTLKLLVAANFPLDTENAEAESSKDIQEFLMLARKIDRIINATEIGHDTDLITNLLYHENTEILIVLAKQCGLFKTLTRRECNAAYLHTLSHLWLRCIPKLLSLPVTRQDSSGRDFLFEFLVFIQRNGESSKIYQNILRELLHSFDTPPIDAIIFILNAFAAIQEIDDWSDESSEDKAAELSDAYMPHIADPQDFRLPRGLHALLIARRRLQESCFALFNDNDALLESALNTKNVDVVHVFLAAGAVPSAKMIASLENTDDLKTTFFLMTVLGDLDLQGFIDFLSTQKKSVIESVCDYMVEEEIKVFTDELFDLGRFENPSEDEEENSARIRELFYLNVAVTGRLEDENLPALVTLIDSNDNANRLFHSNHPQAIQVIELSEEKSEKSIAFHLFVSTLLSRNPSYFLSHVIKNQSQNILIEICILLNTPQGHRGFSERIGKLLWPEERGYNLKLLCAIAIRCVKDNSVGTHIKELLKLIMHETLFNVIKKIENDKSIKDKTWPTLIPFLSLLEEEKRLARPRIVFWHTQQFFRQPPQISQEIESQIIINIARLILQLERSPNIPNLSQFPRRPC